LEIGGGRWPVLLVDGFNSFGKFGQCRLAQLEGEIGYDDLLVPGNLIEDGNELAGCDEGDVETSIEELVDLIGGEGDDAIEDGLEVNAKGGDSVAGCGCREIEANTNGGVAGRVGVGSVADAFPVGDPSNTGQPERAGGNFSPHG
jgi:hypothetical protein